MIKLIRFVVVYELRLWEALLRWILRRPVRVEPGAQRFTYHGAVNLIPGAFIVVSPASPAPASPGSPLPRSAGSS
jgi:hypothetical protein